MKSGTGADAQIYTENRDYKLDEHWGCFGRIPGGRIPADAVVSAELLDIVAYPTCDERIAASREPTFDVMMIIVLRKSTLRPEPSVR